MIIVSKASLKNGPTLVYLSYREPDVWPGSRHRDWRSVGSGHRHRRGDCRGEEDGQILVSTYPTSTGWIHVSAEG